MNGVKRYSKIPTEEMVEQTSVGLAKRILELCRERGMSLYGLSYESAVPLSTLHGIMHTGNPTYKRIEAICCGLGISVNDFFDSSYFEGIGVPEDENKR